MKNQFLIRLWIICPFLIFCCSSLQAQWQFIGSPETGHPLHYASDTGKIYMVANAGLYSSTDPAASWTNIPLPDSISTFNEVYAQQGRLFLLNRSDFANPFISSAAYRSDDNGVTWKNIFPFDPVLWGGLPPVFKGDTMMFMVSGIIAISFDLGDSYDVYPNNLLFVEKVFFHNDQLMATGFNTLLSSNNLGNTWDTVYVSPDSLSALSVSDIGGKLYKYESGWNPPFLTNYISVSLDHGETWELLASLDDNLYTYPQIFGTPEHLFLAETQPNDILYHSADEGVTWEKITTEEYYASFQYVNGTLFGLQYNDQSDGVWLSLDQGHTFQNNTSGFTGADCRDIIHSSDQLWVDANTKIYKNENGNEWPEFTYYENLLAGDELHLIAYVNDVLKRSYDGGHLWYTIPASLFGESEYSGFRNIYAAGDIFFVEIFPDLWYSTDFGETWNIFTALQNEIITSSSYDGQSYVISGDLGTILRSIDGVVWEDVTFDLFAPGVASVQMVHVANDYIYAYAASGNVKLAIGSASWEYFEVEDPHHFTFAPPLDVTAMAHVENILLGAVYGHGVFISLDNAETWRPFNLGLTDYQVLDIDIIGEKIYIGVGGGVWTRPLSDIEFFRFSGTVFNDLNNNGLREGNEPGIENVIVRKQIENTATTSDAEGSFTLYSQINQPDTISATPPSPYAQVTTPPLYVSEPDSQLLIGIYYIPGIYDGSVVITNTTPFRPGFESTITITYKNKGTETADLNIRFPMPDELEYISAYPDPTFLLDTLYWNLNDIAPGTSGNILVNVKVDASVPIGTLIDLYGFIKVSEEGDANPADNETLVIVEVVGSYDPNDKAVFPSGFITPAMIADTARLEYTIRFQNTGNFPATFVRIQDTLSSNLDLTSLEILAASHPYSWKLLPHNVLDVYFDNINLPDSTSDERGSHGFVKIAINAKSSLRLADNIENKAYIYFDFNAPVVTNTVGSTVGFETGIKEPSKLLELSVAPMPVKDILYINVEVPDAQGEVFLSLYDARGLYISSQRSSSLTNIQMNVRDLPAGLYFLKARIADHYGVVKVVKN